ncbi:zinc-ribbon domain-containing protein [Myxococcota bacterium]|nr:zinc-ribbon domain-containing protein [Myxococcota bacterium]
MQFFCDQCKTKYSIADEKVVGKILKLRCKRCDNTIVLKDPRASSVADSAGSSSRGQQLLKDAFKKSFQEDLSSAADVFPSAASEGGGEDHTQIARLPLFESAQPPEEWYLSDSRGQFGPMDFGELVARIKRGEPDHDAVIWRDGFDDWKTVDRVPELKLYAKHLPPPRRSTREMFRESMSFPATSPVATGAFPPALQQNTGVTVNPYAQAPVSAGQSFRSPTMEYPGASSAMINPMAALEMQSAAIRNARMKNWILVAILVVIVGAAAFVLGGKLMEKPSGSPEPPKVAVNPQQEPAMTPEAPKEEPMREVVYVIASQPPEVEGDPANPGSSMGTKNPGTSRPDSSGSGDMGTSEPSMSAPAGTQPRSSADFNSVKQRNIMEIQRCYEMTVRKGQKELVGQSIKFAIKIQPGGSVDTVSFTGEMPPLMRACLGSAIQKWQFPAGTKTDTFSFEMHFN